MRRCLIIEDDPMFVDILTRVVRPYDLEVANVSDAADAIAALSKREYDVIFLDMHLAGSQGAVVLDYLRRVKPHAVARVVAVTGSPGATRHLGPDVPVIDKGNIDTLAMRIRELLV
jgi:CheY-like chemotaxis protein